MSRYRGPRFKKIRRTGALPGLTNKKPRPEVILETNLVPRKTKIAFSLWSYERQLLKYVRIAGKAKGSTSQVLLQLLEMRLDNILFRLGMASTIPGRQLVNHRHILVNGRIVDIPTTIQISLDSSPHEELPNHLTLHPFQYKGLVNQIIDSKWVGLKINELLVVEYYSRRT
ncbi:unnamed protein product [Withania somnifera]